MAFLDWDTGRVAFEDGLVLENGMDSGSLEYTALGQWEMALPAHAVPGGRVGVLLTLREKKVAAITLTAWEIAGRQLPDSARQREFLFALLGLKDPCPDTMGSVRIRAPFGQALMVTQPYTGAASALIEYRQEEP